MLIAFRADASVTIGTGHIARCRTLAHALARKGADILFICRHLPDALHKLCIDDGFQVVMLDTPSTADVSPRGTDYAAWLGVSEEMDAAQTIAVLKNSAAQRIIVDHYALSHIWENAVIASACPVMALDDLGRMHHADIVFDQNYASDPTARYRGQTPSHARLLLGPTFALLHESYVVAAVRRTPPHAQVGRITVFFGGSDAEDMTGRVLEVLGHEDFSHIHLDIVIGATAVHGDALTAIAQHNPCVHLHRSLPTLANLLAEADLAIGGGGGNMWERCCLGVPSLVITIAENQEPASLDLGHAGIIAYAGRQQDLDRSSLEQALRDLIEDPRRRQSMSERSRLLVDGRGAQRIAELLIPTLADELYLRRATPADSDFLLRLANDPDVRAQSFNSAPISWETHQAWFRAKIADRQTQLFILEAKGLAVGQIRFDIKGDVAVLNYALDSLVRGRGWGGLLVENGLRALAETWQGEVHAAVKAANRASRAIFEKLAFQTVQPAREDDLLFTRAVPGLSADSALSKR